MGKQKALSLTAVGRGLSQGKKSPSLALAGEGLLVFECPSYTTPFSAKRLWGKARKRPIARAKLAQAFPLRSPGALRRGASLWLGRGGYSGFDNESNCSLSLQLRDSAGLGVWVTRHRSSPIVPLASGLWGTSTIAVFNCDQTIAQREGLSSRPMGSQNIGEICRAIVNDARRLWPLSPWIG
jgi:hypothetical protein